MTEDTGRVIIAIVGPTAVGKSALALQIAEAISAEIVSADSMQGYRGMDIGTAKPSLEDQQRVRHHLVDEWSPRDEISVVDVQEAARSAIDDILRRGLVPIVVGGSWLYVQAIVDRLDFPPTDPQVRARWQAELERIGSQLLHERLRDLDAASAAAIDPGNGRRIVRALEVIEITGTFTARLPEPQPWRETRWLGMDASRPELDARIRERVDAMWRSGFVDEVRRVRTEGMGRTASRALGYRQIAMFLDGVIDEDAAREDTVRATVRFARRQQRRFRQDDRIAWLDSARSVDDALARIGQDTRT